MVERRKKSIPELTLNQENSPPENSIPEEQKDYVEAKSAAKALKFGRENNLFTDYDEREVFDFTQVYFIGKPGIKKIKATIVKQPNCGYDDD